MVKTDPITIQEDNAEQILSVVPEPYKLKYANVMGDDLMDFLVRPRVLVSYIWGVGSSLSYVINPWSTFFSLAEVKAKVGGYARFRGNLKLQILVNGSAFHRGTAYVSYLPLSRESVTSLCKYNDGILTTAIGVGVGSPNGAAYHGFGAAAANPGLSSLGAYKLVPISQRQHIRVYPNTNTGGEMVLPFVFPHEYMPIDTNFGGLGTITQTCVDAGELRMDSVGLLTFLGSNAPDGVDITVLASLEPGYELAGPTVYLQSGEAPGGSKIGKKAPKNPQGSSWTGMVANYGPTVARLMGFTNPPILSSVDSVRIVGIPNLANSQLSNRDEVLALHPETTLLSLNESLGGSESDMLITNMVQKESVLTAFLWKATGATSLVNSVLFTNLVHPCISPTRVKLGGSTVSHYDQTFGIPMDWVAQTFMAWQGDIIYTFEVVTTAFQKGRLKVSYEPSGNFGVNTNSLGINYSKILDIADGCKFEFRVPYMGTTPWLMTDHCDPQSRDGVSTNYTFTSPGSLDYPTETFLKHNPRTMNGQIRVQVLNTLTNDLDATVIVGVRGAENLKFAIPCGLSERISLQDQFFLQSGDSEYIGETVVSIRDLCHRSTPCGYFRSANTQMSMYTLPATGVPRGIGLNGGDAQLMTHGGYYGLGSVSPHSFYHWYSSGFAACRSSFKLSVGGVGSNKPYGAGSNGELVCVDRGLNKLTINTFTEDPTYPALKVRPASISLNAVGQDSVYNWMGLWSGLLKPADGASMLAKDGGGVVVPYQNICKFQPSNAYFDYYRLVSGLSSGSLIGEPVYTAGTGAAHNGARLNGLTTYFTPESGVKVLTSSDSRTGGAFTAYTAAGADMAFGQFCNAPTWFTARRTNAFTKGQADAVVALVLSKMVVTYDNLALLPSP